MRRGANSSKRSPVRPIIIFQSDDWGRVGIPSPGVLGALQAAGHPVGQSPWDWYGLETAQDLGLLADTLAEFRDQDGGTPTFTANFVVANADLPRMVREDFTEFRWIALTQGFPEPRETNLAPVYRELAHRRAFYPGLHGFTHFNPDRFLAALNEGTILGDRARTMARLGVPYFASLTPEYNFALVSRAGAKEAFVDEERQRHWLGKATGIFEELFGLRPRTACAPGYRANSVTLRVWEDLGIEAYQLRGNSGIETGKILGLNRNVYFEPALASDLDIPTVLEQARRAAFRGAPIIICTHSINYITQFGNWAERSRQMLRELIGGLLSSFPDLRFATEGQLIDAFQRQDADWLRPLRLQERVCRILS